MNISISLLEESAKIFEFAENERSSQEISYKKSILNNVYLYGDLITYTYGGFCLISYDFEILNDCHERISINSEFIQISFALAGRSVVRRDKQLIKMKSGCVNLAYLHNHTVDIKMLKKEKKVSHIRLVIDKKYFVELMSEVGWSIEKSFISKILESQHFMFGNISIATEIDLLERLKEIIYNNYPPPLDLIILKHKIIEIFMRMHHLFEKKQIYSQESNNVNELDQLEKAKIYLENNYSDPPTIKELSKIVYLNEFKLKNGFKKLYGKTIHEYLTNIRMKKAKELLAAKLQVSEISNILGFRTPSHFIQTFKKHFGCTPKQLKFTYILFANLFCELNDFLPIF